MTSASLVCRSQTGAGSTRRASGDAGVGIVEVLITVTLLSVVFVGALGALGALVAASSTERDQAIANGAIVTAAEAIEQAELTDDCDVADDEYQAIARAAPAIPTSWDASDITVTVPGCTPGSTVQEIEVVVASPTGSVVDRLRITKFESADAPA